MLKTISFFTKGRLGDTIVTRPRPCTCTRLVETKTQLVNVYVIQCLHICISEWILIAMHKVCKCYLLMYTSIPFEFMI